MAIKCKAASRDAQRSMAELLVALQLDGHLHEAALPDWADGTGVAEIFDAVRMLGDGEWLAGLYPDLGVYESAEQWLADFLEGKPVPTPGETAIARDDSDREGEAEDASEIAQKWLATYGASLPAKQSKAFLRCLGDDEFFVKALEGVASCLSAMASLRDEDDASFARQRKTFAFLDAEFLADKALAGMARAFVVEWAPKFLASTNGLNAHPDRAARRIKSLAVSLANAAGKVQMTP